VACTIRQNLNTDGPAYFGTLKIKIEFQHQLTSKYWKIKIISTPTYFKPVENKIKIISTLTYLQPLENKHASPA